MAQHVNLVRGYITPEMVIIVSETVGETEARVSNAVSLITAGFLYVFSKRGNTPQIENILREAGNLDILSDIGNLCEEKPLHDQQRIGDNFTQHLLGDKAADFTNPIAKQAGIPPVATNRLVDIIAPVIAGILGNKLVKEHYSMKDLIDEADKEREDIVPAALVKTFGTKATPEIASNGNKTASSANNKKGKKNRSWIIWLVVIILLLLALLLWRFCCNSKSEVKHEKETTVSVTQSTATAEQSKDALTLPNGVKLVNAYKGGIEDKMIRFIQSDEYKNATSEDLKKKWFEFDKVRFEFNSSDNLMAGSDDQLNNIAAILNYYKDVRVKIGGYADKKGGEAVNLEISKERAKTIERLLEEKGVTQQIARIEGYGEEFATHNVDESDQARSVDRDIALRFVK